MRRPLPSGVVTLLFTDIEGSTRLLREIGDRYPDALAEHRRLLRSAFEARGGVEVDTQGDAFFVAFARATDAVEAATDAQRALAEGQVQVRMGIHTGQPGLTGEGYVGLDLHRGARIAAAGHGGQVLLSESTRALVSAPVRDLGRHRLQDLAEPEQLYQLEIPGLRADFPLLRTLEAGQTNLPAHVTSFLGREAELAEVDRNLDDPDRHLVTLVGPGGAGKTRLAIEAGGRRADRYPHGVYLVPLVAVHDPQLIVSAIAHAIGFTIDTMYGPERTPEVQLQNYLADRSMLLLLDNFEHLIEGADLVGRLVEAAPQLDVLMTSRERLGLAAEWLVEVKGLQTAAEQLFADRARQVEPRFRLDDSTSQQVGRICRAVEAMPLAIELAAASMAVLSPAELADEIERNLDVLTASARDVPERHRSLRAAFEGSWRLLTDAERGAFARLAVFRGTFSRDAAAAVADAPLPVLGALVAKSLVRRSETGRFELHELLRQYAAEAFLRDAELSRALRERHGAYYNRFLRERATRLAGPEMLTARDELRLEKGNILAAVEWAAVNGTDTDAPTSLRALDAFYHAHGWAEGAEVFDRLEGTIVDSHAAVRGAADGVLRRARAIRTWRLAAVNSFEASDAVGRGVLEELREAGDQWDTSVCLLALGTNAVNRGEAVEATALLDEARDRVLDRDEPFLLCWIDLWLGWAILEQGDTGLARSRFDEALAAARTTGSEANVAFSLSKLGIVADAERDFATGLRYHLEAQRGFERVGDPAGVGYAMSRASLSSYALGDYASSLRYGQAALEAFASINHTWGIITSQGRVGFAAMRLGDLDTARRALTAAFVAANGAKLQYLAIYALAGLAGVIGGEGEVVRAATILTVLGSQEGLPLQYRQVVSDELSSVEPMLTAEQLAEARRAAADTTMDALVGEWLPEPTPSTLASAAR